MTVPWAVWPFLTALLMFATHRITRLLVADEIPIIRVPRDKLCDWLDPRSPDGRPAGLPGLGAPGRSIAYLMTCPWCMSVWVAAGVVWSLDWRLSVPWPPLLVAAASTVTGLIAQRESEHEKRWQMLDVQAQLFRAQLAEVQRTVRP